MNRYVIAPSILSADFARLGEEIAAWAGRIAHWMEAGILQAFVYFDNDALGHAPFDAERLAARLSSTVLSETGRSPA